MLGKVHYLRYQDRIPNFTVPAIAAHRFRKQIGAPGMGSVSAC